MPVCLFRIFLNENEEINILLMAVCACPVHRTRAQIFVCSLVGRCLLFFIIIRTRMRCRCL